MNTYHAFYKGKKIELQAESSYKAQLKAAELLKAKKSFEVTIVLVSVGEREVVHVATE